MQNSILDKLSRITKNKDALELLKPMEFPNQKCDEWKYFDLDVALLYQNIEILELDESLEVGIKNNSNKYNIVFINGHFSKKMSHIDDLDVHFTTDSARCCSFQNCNCYSCIFSALSALSLQGSLTINIPSNITLSKAIEISFIYTQKHNASVMQPRIFVNVGQNSSISLTEHYTNDVNIASSGNIIFMNSTVNIYLSENAKCSHYKIQDDQTEAMHLSRTNIMQAKNSATKSYVAMLGGMASRSEYNIFMQEPYAHASLSEIFITKSKMRHNLLTKVYHISPFCTSKITCKGVVYSGGSCAFDGLITVSEGSIKTDALMINKNLLLSESAEMNTRPRLDIHNDDVRCAHGATISHLDRDALFYMRVRGITKEVAEKMLTRGFIGEILSEIPYQFRRDIT